MRRRTADALVAFVGLALLLAAPAFADARRDKTLDYLERTLRRLGETDSADRLRREAAAGRISFAAIDAGVVAEVKAGALGWGGPSSNHLTFTDEMLRLADSDRLLQKRPYGRSSSLVSYATTVVHEFVHLDQAWPDQVPKYEDPAYARVDETMGRWVDRLRSEFSAASRGPASSERTAQLAELDDLLARIGDECRTQDDDLKKRVAEGKVSRGKSWRFLEHAQLCDAVRAQIAALRGVGGATMTMAPGPAAGGAASASAAQPQPTAPRGVWQLMRSEAWNTDPPAAVSEADAKHEHALTVTAAMAEARFRWAGKQTRVRCTWKGVPDRVTPGEIVDITVTGSDAGSEGPGGFIGCRPLLLVIRAPGAPAELVAGGRGRETYGTAGEPVSENRYSLPVPAGAPGQVLILQFGAISSIRSGGINLTYSHR